MVQNHLSIDFRHTVRGTNSYEFGYNVEHSIEVATSIVLQHYDGKKSLPAWYVKNDKRLYADTINGYWNVDGFILTFVAGSDPAADIEARVSALESASVQQAGEIVELEGNITGIESSIREINSTLSVQSTDISSLKTRTTAVENKANTNETNISSLSSRMATAEGNIDSLASRMAIAESDISSNATDISSLKTRTTAVENKSNTNETNISSLSSRIATAEGNIASNTSDITSLKTRVTRVETENALLLSYLKSMDIYRIASGNPATFSDAKAANVRDLLVTITPTQSGSGTPSPENIRPFIGYDSVTVQHWQRNLWPFGGNVTFVGSTNDIGSGYLTNFTTPLPAGTYTLSALVTSTDTTDTECLALVAPASNLTATLASLYFSRGVRESHTFTASRPIGAIYLYAARGWGSSRGDSSTWSDAQLESGSTATDYQPHNIYTASTGEAGTVYGGTLNVTTGELTVTYGHIASYNGETVPDGWTSSTGDLSTGAEVVYPLATPLTYSLTPTQIATLAGYNAISADTGPVSVTYKADPSITLE